MYSDPYKECLDDPTLPFQTRWDLIREIDQTNHQFGIYKRILKIWEKNFLSNFTPEKEFSLFEVGSGSGGLSLRLLNWANEKKFKLKINLYDAQMDILNESAVRFPKNNPPQIHLATDKHLQVYPDDSFDFVISLHVIHHIQPYEIAQSAIQQMLRISRKGVLIVDLQYRPWMIPLADFFNRLWGVSTNLRLDGKKSLLRAYNYERILQDLKQSPSAAKFDVSGNVYRIEPYWFLIAKK